MDKSESYKLDYEEGYHKTYEKQLTPEQRDYNRGRIQGQYAIWLGKKARNNFSGKSEAYKRGYLDGYQKNTKNALSN